MDWDVGKKMFGGVLVWASSQGGTGQAKARHVSEHNEAMQAERHGGKVWNKRLKAKPSSKLSIGGEEKVRAMAKPARLLKLLSTIEERHAPSHPATHTLPG